MIKQSHTLCFLVVVAGCAAGASICPAQHFHGRNSHGHGGEVCPAGVCVPNPANFGFYQTGWRRWPTSSLRPAEDRPDGEAVPSDSLPAAETPDPRFEGEITPPGASFPNRATEAPEPQPQLPPLEGSRTPQGERATPAAPSLEPSTRDARPDRSGARVRNESPTALSQIRRRRFPSLPAVSGKANPIGDASPHRGTIVAQSGRPEANDLHENVSDLHENVSLRPPARVVVASGNAMNDRPQPVLPPRSPSQPPRSGGSVQQDRAESVPGQLPRVSWQNPFRRSGDSDRVQTQATLPPRPSTNDDSRKAPASNAANPPARIDAPSHATCLPRGAQDATKPQPPGGVMRRNPIRTAPKRFGAVPAGYEDPAMTNPLRSDANAAPALTNPLRNHKPQPAVHADERGHVEFRNPLRD